MDKPFRAIDEQIDILQARGLSIDKSTSSILRREGYYSVVNGYKDIFIDVNRSARVGDDRYVKGSSFSDLYRLFTFDRDLRMTMMRYFAQAEAALKAICSHSFSKEHRGNLEAYLDRSSYRPERLYDTRINRLIVDFKKALNRCPYEGKGYRREYIKHYATVHDEVPMWVLSRFLMMGQIFKFYEFQTESMRNEIAKGFSTLYAETHERKVKISPRRLRLAFDHIKDFRNICAHDERLYCARVSPSLDINFSGVLVDLELILTKDENARLLNEILGLVSKLGEAMDDKSVIAILKAMGIEELWDRSATAPKR